MLRARNATRMPPDRPLPEADIRLIERWIRAGAPRHQIGPDGGDGPRVTVTVLDGAAREGGGEAGEVREAGGDGSGEGGAGDAGITDGGVSDGSSDGSPDATVDANQVD
jgi:hypothetical protein